MTAVSSTAQEGGTPLLLLCGNTSVKAEMIQALGALHPAAASERGSVIAGWMLTIEGTPLHFLCKNTSVTVEMMQALHAFHPAAAGEKDKVNPPRLRNIHAR